MSIQPCRPKSDSALPGAIWAQFRPKKLNQKAIPAHGRTHFNPGTKSALAIIGLYWPWFKGATLDPKIGLYFTHRNGLVFRAKTDLSDLECVQTKLLLDWICFFCTVKFPYLSLRLGVRTSHLRQKLRNIVKLLL